MTSTEFSKYIFNVRDQNGISRPAFSKKWNYHPNTIKSYEKEGRLPPVDYLAALSMETGESFIKLTRLLLSVGPLSHSSNYLDFDRLLEGDYEVVINESPVKYDKKRHSGVRFALDTDAMAPTIASGAVVTCDEYKDVSQIKDGKIILLNIEGNLTARRIQYLVDGQVLLRCDNNNYESMTISKEALSQLNILGIVTFTLNPV